MDELILNTEAKRQFLADMEDAGRDVRQYRGRNSYSGPAVVIEPDELQDVIRETSTRLQSDNLGRDLIVYPAG